jgi:guanylate kinase
VSDPIDQVLGRVGRVPVLAVLTGPSGVGKDTVVRELARSGHPFVRVVTCTTRPPRPGERHGVDYWFVSVAEYAQLLASNALIEHAEVYGFSYGVPRQPIADALRAGQDVLLRIDVQGALTIKQRIPSAVLVFLAAPSLAAQEERLRRRQTDDEEKIRRRLETARAELAQIDCCDYLIISEDGQPERAAGLLRAVLVAERHRRSRGDPLAELEAFSLMAAVD